MVEVSVQVDFRFTIVELGGKQIIKGPPAGFEMVMAVIEYFEHDHEILIGRFTADTAITLLGGRTEEVTFTMRGRCMKTGEPKAYEATTSQVLGAISDVLDELVQLTAANLALKLKGMGYYDLVNRRLVPNTIDAEHVTLRGELKHLIGLRNRLEAALGVPVVVEG